MNRQLKRLIPVADFDSLRVRERVKLGMQVIAEFVLQAGFLGLEGL